MLSDLLRSGLIKGTHEMNINHCALYSVQVIIYTGTVISIHATKQISYNKTFIAVPYLIYTKCNQLYSNNYILWRELSVVRNNISVYSSPSQTWPERESTENFGSIITSN